MRYYYYLLNNSGTKEQYYIGLNSQDQNISVTKIKNAISKEAVKTLSKLIGVKDSENIKQLEKAIKNSIYDTCTLLEGYNNIEVTGTFNKTESKTVAFQNLITDRATGKVSYIETEGEKVNSKVYPNLDLYLIKYAYGKGYSIIYEGLQIGYTRTKDIKSIDEVLNNMNITESELINKVNEQLVKLGVKEEITVIEQTVSIENNTIENIDIKDDMQVNTIATTNIKDSNIKVNRNSIKPSKMDINNNIYNPYTINETGSYCNTG